MHALITFMAPLIFVLIHSTGLFSAVGTIFVAAACMTISELFIALRIEEE